jgi:hypothetical protein
VAILPYLGESESKLYDQFKVDEPWDSPHNKKLLSQMPKIYAPPGVTTQDPASTFYQVLVGPHAAFEEHRGISASEFTDGTSITLLIVEAGRAVPWSKPEDINFAMDEPVPKLGGMFPGIFNAAFADGSVWTLPKNVDAETLRRLIMRDDGQPVDVNEVRVANRREASMREQNKRLKQEVQLMRRQLEDLQHEKEVLEQMAEDAGTELLNQENDSLLETLRQSRKELQRLKEDVQSLKRSLQREMDQRQNK